MDTLIKTDNAIDELAEYLESYKIIQYFENFLSDPLDRNNRLPSHINMSHLDFYRIAMESSKGKEYVDIMYTFNLIVLVRWNINFQILDMWDYIFHDLGCGNVMYTHEMYSSSEVFHIERCFEHTLLLFKNNIEEEGDEVDWVRFSDRWQMLMECPKLKQYTVIKNITFDSFFK